MRDMDIWHFTSHGDEIVRHGGVEKLAVGIVTTMLHQRRAEPLHDAATDLLIETGSADRLENMLAFSQAALELLAATIEKSQRT